MQTKKIKTDNILHLFHHIHHKKEGKTIVHEVHHCGGDHIKVDPKLNYSIKHCPCGRHSISKEIAIGHATGGNLKPKEVKIKFREKCPDGGWHIETGIGARD